MSFFDKTVLIVGASSGIGRELALQLAAQGAKTALMARNTAALEALVAEISAKGGMALVVPGDVTDRQQVATACAQAQARFGFIEAVFLASGIGSREIAQNADSAEAERLIKVNYLGPVMVLEQLLPDMQRHNCGLIVAISSLAAHRGLPGCGSYCAAKAALTTLLESWGTDLQGTRIRICIASPYFVSTPMSNPDGAPKPPPWTTAAEAAAIILRAAAAGRAGVSFPLFFRLFMFVQRLLPLPLFRSFWRLAKRGG